MLIPSFAVGRTQDVLHYLGELQKAGRLPARMNVFVDSPMALAATRITLKYAKLPPIERLRFTESVEESRAIGAVRAGAVILSASGMCDGGRIRYHLRDNVSRPECAIVFPSFQAAGTLGRSVSLDCAAANARAVSADALAARHHNRTTKPRARALVASSVSRAGGGAADPRFRAPEHRATGFDERGKRAHPDRDR